MKPEPMFAIRTGVNYLIFFASLFIFNGCFTSSGDPTPGGGNNKTPEPTPNFTYFLGDKGSVNFTNLSTNASSYEWDFGDQSDHSFALNPMHTYNANGSFSVTLTATGDGGSETFTALVEINNVPGKVIYENTTQTDVTITINGETKVVAPGGTVTFSGESDSLVIGTATTSGATSDGTPIGLVLTFTIKDTFKSSPSINELQVGGKFFFLTIKNSWAYPITTVYVNYGLPNQTVDYIQIPNDGQTYSVGYYENGYDEGYTPNVRFEYGSQVWSSNIYPGFFENTIADVEVE